ncbi:endogenous retrovirus group K member 9 Pol protein-like protein [Leptotrombidium deliense]|uniref:Endogenous retrovirus group K member 9 Pol protein-like protein n=1 Tax=Leptotrombidium deliense TaxID=299467 RepID=A0A443RWQ2_9ACAR|nr:endogenous retrovirus group K member 9 Pol protein-like protein [Leptotrombidium deliense]
MRGYPTVPTGPSDPLPSHRPNRISRGDPHLDLCASTGTILTPDMGVQIIPTNTYGPLPEGTIGLLLGRSSDALKGLCITPGVIAPTTPEKFRSC